MATPLKGYRWSSFDRELVAFLTALRGDPGPTHLMVVHQGRLAIPPNTGELARAMVAADVEFPLGFLVTLLVEASLNESGRMVAGNDIPYAQIVRPFVHFQGGVNDSVAAFDFLRSFFRGRVPSTTTIHDMTSQLATEWAQRHSQIFDRSFVLNTLVHVAGNGDEANPFATGFKKALEKVRQATPDED